MIDAGLLDILVCPESKQPVALADSAALAALNQRISEGTVRTLGGEVVSQPLTAGLLREDGRRLYPVRDDIPVMLIDESIEVDRSDD